MNKIIFVILSLSLISAAFGKIFRDGKFLDESAASASNPKLVKYINSLSTSWKARNHKLWNGWSIKQVKKLLGSHLYTATNEKRETHTEEQLKAAPASFDSRNAWPNCTTIGTILNQAKCGSCWAFGAVESITDRFCIFSNATINVPLSETDLVTCDDEQDGCNGGDPRSAWSWVERHGLVSSECSPYTIPTCPPEEQPCLVFVPTPACVKKCVNSSESWSSSKRFLSRSYYVSSNPNDISAEIVSRGPVEAAFSVYEDFIHYKSGVYQHTAGSYLGGHAIKIIGYGTENGLPFWLVANSWTTYWGDQGFFKIKKGDNQCGIESGVVGGIPKL